VEAKGTVFLTDLDESLPERGEVALIFDYDEKENQLYLTGYSQAVRWCQKRAIAATNRL